MGSVRICLLVISPIGILNPKTGYQIRVYNLISQLAKRGFNIIVLKPEEKIRYENETEKVKLSVERFKNFTPPNLNDFNIFLFLKLCKILKEKNLSAIQVEGCSGVLASRIATRLFGKDVKIVYDAHNVEGDRVRYIKDLPLIKRVFAPLVIPLVEKIAVKIADHIISVSHKDKELFTKRYDIKPNKITVIPSGANLVNLRSLEIRSNARKRFGIKNDDIIIVFHGTYTYQPNKEAIQLIMNFIAPKIMENYSNVKFIVAGKDVPKFEKGNLKFVGFVDDLYSLLSASDIAIVPILRGGGTRLKIMDYMAVGLPIVTTKKGIEGIEAESGKHVIIVDDVNEEFIKAIKYLIDNEQERKRIGANARRLAEEEYDWGSKIGEKLDGLYRKLIEKK